MAYRSGSRCVRRIPSVRRMGSRFQAAADRKLVVRSDFRCVQRPKSTGSTLENRNLSRKHVHPILNRSETPLPVCCRYGWNTAEIDWASFGQSESVEWVSSDVTQRSRVRLVQSFRPFAKSWLMAGGGALERLPLCWTRFSDFSRYGYSRFQAFSNLLTAYQK